MPMRTLQRLLVLVVAAITVSVANTAIAQQSDSSGTSDPSRDGSSDETAPDSEEIVLSLVGSTLISEYGDQVHRIDTPCSSPEMARTEDRVFLSCGERGVYLLNIDPATGRIEPDEFQSLGGRVTGLFEANGQVWATVERVEARPLGTGSAVRKKVTASTEQAPGTPDDQQVPAEPTDDETESVATPDDVETPVEETPPSDRPVAGVISTEPGAVIVDLGKKDGLERDDHVELFHEETVELGTGETSTRINTLAVGRVVALSEGRARVELGLGERVDDDARARPTGAPRTTYPTAPPRIGDIWEASVAFRPFLALRTVGVGTVSSARIVYRFEGPYAIHVNALPLSAGLAREGNVSALGADLALAYDARVFSLGLGAGAAQIGTSSLGGIDIDEQGGLTITQFGRIGSRDGLHLRLHNSFIVANREFFFAGTDATIQVPIDSVVSNSWLVFHGGGHVAGEVVGEAGLRLLVRGNGDRGSLFVTPTVGGGLVSNEKPIANCQPEFTGDCTELVSYGGPLIGLELEWRL